MIFVLKKKITSPAFLAITESFKKVFLSLVLFIIFFFGYFLSISVCV